MSVAVRNSNIQETTGLFTSTIEVSSMVSLELLCPTNVAS